MDYSLPVISWIDIGVIFLPMVIVFVLMFRWSLQAWTAVYSTARMLLQLILIGYFLVYIFEAQNAWIICLVLAVMLTVASWISLNPVQAKRRYLYPYVLVSLAVGGGLVLFLVVWGVLHIEPWYRPQYTVPLAGMIFANSMNTVSLSAERFESEISNGRSPEEAKIVAFQTGMIPVINSMFAVGLVALPGMMTGQILSGVSPLIAVRYQIVVMCMLFAASGICAAIYLVLVSRRIASAGSELGFSE
ncbi:MAG: ABC transporter permease [Gammaproteobacteria bacterium]|nr:ABC transporter permease [Gammaproteobacteria bacterium]MBT5205276.1 ABC transporter permease [Gammaproteobacteria bacterium]MBT5601430.1 ABC transporter permease [Gammaproteobacteria bacterium]MBT6246592.1 ABC transporter permease [Gammaproteobacteria bacterium]